MDCQIKVLILLLVLISINHSASNDPPTILLILLLSFNHPINSTRRLVVSNLLLETEVSQFDSSFYLCAEVSCLQ